MLKKLRKALSSDSSCRTEWTANLTMSFMDSLPKSNEEGVIIMTREETIKAVNEAAGNFIKLIIYKG